MTETEKKELAEWLKSPEIVMMNGNFFKYQPNKPPWGKVPWNPDTNPEQFIEVYENLNNNKIELIQLKLNCHDNALGWGDYLMRRKPEVITALLQTINQ